MESSERQGAAGCRPRLSRPARAELAAAGAGLAAARARLAAAAPTLRCEGLPLAESAGTVSRRRAADGRRPEAAGLPAAPFDAFARTLPDNRQALFAGLDHGASGDPGAVNRGGQPAALAPTIRSFFSPP